MLRFTGRLLLMFGLCLWLGSLVFFIVGVAPVNFGTAKEWNLTGSNPAMAEQPIHWRTVGGEITGRSITRLNLTEWAGFTLCLAGLFLLMAHRTSKTRKRQLMLFAVMGVILFVYSGILGTRLQEIRSTVPLDFSDNSTTKTSEIHQSFDTMHIWYTRLTTVNAFFLIVQVVMFALPSGDRRT